MDTRHAQMQATRELLSKYVKGSPLTAKYIAEQVGEEYTTFVHRLKGRRATYQQLDTSLVIDVLAVLDIPLDRFFVEVKKRAEELSQQ